MYEKPVIEKFGTFRELTQVGVSGGDDGCVYFGGDPASGGTIGDDIDPACADATSR